MFPITKNDLHAELGAMESLTVAALQERRAAWAAERAAIEALWVGVEHLEEGDPEREAVADRDWAATKAFYAYNNELRAAKVDKLRAAGATAEEFALARGLGLGADEE